ncbi:MULTISPECIES: hypothetical protein [unclassified Gemella]|uniref:hypothetical protein n=1 Tax=unclassified Gemella TaxID=2624949 RepID=UPI001C054A09|nr:MULTISPECIES: hypothetical protein [unclassified Gemella]MBU0279001.1 hypothetical protein [Gemella sp. zg-1178]QWQ38735.1 hypothetical protein KMP11_07280 [Gemella sp. zg-570]
MSRKLKFASSVLASSLIITPISALVSNYDNVAKANELKTLNNYEPTEKEINEFAKELEFFFTKVVCYQNGKYFINKEEAKKIKGISDDVIIELEKKANEINNNSFVSFRSWYICMKDRIMDEIGKVVQLGTLGASILERQAWTELAEFILKRVSKQAAKRSPWVLAGIFAWHSLRCVGH